MEEENKMHRGVHVASFQKFSAVGKKNWLDRSSSSTPMRWGSSAGGEGNAEAGVGGAEF